MIKLQCKCGHTLNLPEKLAGQKIRCKRCAKVMRVPQGAGGGGRGASPSDSDPEFLVQGTRACSGCGQMYPPSVVVCVACGLNVDTGAMLYASVEEEQVPPGVRLPGDRGQEGGWFKRLLKKLGWGK